MKFFNLSETGTTYVSEKPQRSENLILAIARLIVFGAITITTILTLEEASAFVLMFLGVIYFVIKLAEVME